MTKTKTKLMPPGEYYVGDLMYLATDKDQWLMDAAWQPDRGDVHYFKSPDGLHHGCSMRTAYGDGIYYDNDGDGYYVDSGSLGIISVDALDAEQREAAERCGCFVWFEIPFECKYTEEHGICSFGTIYIQTNPDGI